MPKFQLAATVTVSAYTTVEADTLEDAIKIAEGRDVGLGCHGFVENELWIIEDADGEAENIGPAGAVSAEGDDYPFGAED